MTRTPALPELSSALVPPIHTATVGRSYRLDREGLAGTSCLETIEGVAIWVALGYYNNFGQTYDYGGERRGINRCKQRN